MVGIHRPLAQLERMVYFLGQLGSFDRLLTMTFCLNFNHQFKGYLCSVINSEVKESGLVEFLCPVSLTELLASRVQKFS